MSMDSRAAVASTLRRPRPWAASLLNLVGPGLGSVYNGRPLRALATWLIASVGFAVVLWVILQIDHRWMRMGLLVALPIVTFGGALWDGWRVARRTDAAPRKTYQRWYGLLGAALVLTIVMQPLAALAIKVTVGQAMKVRGRAGVPNVWPGDSLVTTPLSRSAPIQRGDLIVHRREDGRLFIHRAVGIPGDVVEVRGLRARVNGVDEDSRRVVFDPPPSHTGRASSDLGPFRVPEGQYFLLGDNRTNSMDSRHFGPVARERIVGQPRWVFFSMDERTGPRWDRIGVTVR